MGEFKQVNHLRSRSNLINIKPCTGRSNNNVPSVMLSNTMPLAPKIDEVQFPGYFLLRRDRASDSHGGVRIYISERIQYEHLINYQSVGE